MGNITDADGRYLGLQVVVKGTLSNPATTALLASSITDKNGKAKQYDHFYIKIDSSAGNIGTIKVTNTHGDTLTLNYNVLDEWYPEPIASIVGDLGSAREIVYGVAF
ncbi:MAG: hypothetical protein ACXAC7_24045 [Candidatus Hodarchaeales archaeon]|jgi:hypothetical protein